MIEVRYTGRLGNNLFQYCLGRILAEGLGFKLKADPIPGFPNTGLQTGGFDYSEYPSQVLNSQKVDMKGILLDKSKRKIVLDGYFQRYEYYKEYKEPIRNNWLLRSIQRKSLVGENDIVVCIRRGDYLPEHTLPFSYYEKALRSASYDRVFVCTDSPLDPFILWLSRKYKASVSSGHYLDDFAFIVLFNKIIISRSSFYWWAAFLSKANEIYCPIPAAGRWSSGSDIDLRVDDEARYVYIKCKEPYKLSFTDRLILLKRKTLPVWR